jgi:hypothetical protein
MKVSNTMKDMRLIDANKFEVISWKTQGSKEYADGFDDGVNYICQKIDETETVDAIPIEWITNKMSLMSQECESGEVSIIMSLVNWWHEDQRR